MLAFDFVLNKVQGMKPRCQRCVVPVYSVVYCIHTHTVDVVYRTLKGMCYKSVENMWSMQGQLKEWSSLNTKGSRFKFIRGHAENTHGGETAILESGINVLT